MSLPAAFYEQQRRGKQQARALRGMKPQEISVETWLGGHRHLFPDERTDKSKQDDIYKLAPFRRAYGDHLMQSITPIQAQAWALKNPIQVGHLRAAWDRAVLLEIVPLNIWKLVTMPRSKKAKRRPPSEGELTAIVVEYRRRGLIQLANMVLVAAYTGARQGGLLRLRRCDVDLRAGRMTVTEKGDKTRTLVLGGPALDAMRAQFRQREVHLWQQQGAFGRGHSPLVFVNGEAREKHKHQHKPFYARGVQARWQECRGDFPHGFHALKHFAATWLAAKGVDDNDIAVQLGHTDSEGRPYPELVQRIYNHPDNDAALERVAGGIRARAQIEQLRQEAV